MKNFICAITVILLLVSVDIQGSNIPSGLEHSVQKYKNATVDKNAVKKLARYDHYIRYFTSFSYFVPRHKVSANFVRALILAESSGNPRAISNKNALGLGQILFSTGKKAARELGINVVPEGGSTFFHNITMIIDTVDLKNVLSQI